MSESVSQLFLKPSELASVIEKLYKWQTENQKYTSIFLHGSVGVGKTSTVNAVAKKLRINVIDVIASQLDPVDVKGLPVVKEKRTEWTIPSFLPKDQNSKGILFLDELSNSSPAVMNALLKFILERRVEEYALGNGWIIIAAGNRASDRCYVTRLSAALSNRFIHINVEPDLEGWTEWATINNVSSKIIAFLNYKKQPTLFMTDKFDDRSFCTPRSWEFASDILKAGFSGHILQTLLEGTIGTGATIELIAFIKATSHISAEDVLANPTKIAIPESADVLWSLVTALVPYVKDKENLPALFKFALRLSDNDKEEFSLMFVRSLVKMMTALKMSPSTLVLIKGGLWEQFSKRFKAILDII